MASMIVGIIFTLTIILLLGYMNARVGLLPEEYEKEEIKYEV